MAQARELLPDSAEFARRAGEVGAALDRVGQPAWAPASLPAPGDVGAAAAWLGCGGGEAAERLRAAALGYVAAGERALAAAALGPLLLQARARRPWYWGT